MSTLAPHALPVSRRQVASALVLGFLAAGAWVATVDRMGGVETGDRFTVGSLGFFVVLWVLMMAAMMFPSVWPAVAVYGAVSSRRGGTRLGGRSLVFVAGYISSWAAFGLAAFALLAVVRKVGLDALSGEELARYVVAPVALAAALYQATPVKRACLRGCRGPFSFFLEHWREGKRGALWMGSRHGTYCVGCCWMLMLVLLSLGLMSFVWMAVVSLAIAVEKLTPPRWGRLASGLLAAALGALALVALAKPSWLPGGMGGMAGGMDADAGKTR